MTTSQRIAQILGVAFILVAVLGFVTSKGSMEADPAAAPKILGLFAVNVLHNVVHLLFGLWGLAAARSPGAAQTFGLAGGVIYILLAIAGVFMPTTFGLIPIGGHDMWLHGLLGLVLLGMGLSARNAAKAEVLEAP